MKPVAPPPKFSASSSVDTPHLDSDDGSGAGKTSNSLSGSSVSSSPPFRLIEVNKVPSSFNLDLENACPVGKALSPPVAVLGEPRPFPSSQTSPKPSLSGTPSSDSVPVESINLPVRKFIHESSTVAPVLSSIEETRRGEFEPSRSSRYLDPFCPIPVVPDRQVSSSVLSSSYVTRTKDDVVLQTHAMASPFKKWHGNHHTPAQCNKPKADGCPKQNITTGVPFTS
eukprot:15240615-Ditylum_brightwellii.AAC.1